MEDYTMIIFNKIFRLAIFFKVDKTVSNQLVLSSKISHKRWEVVLNIFGSRRYS
jgi:hypothetical protein